MKALYGIALSVLWRISVEPLIKSFRNLQYWKCLVRTVKHERCLHFTQQIVTHVKAAGFQHWNIMKLLRFAHTTACSLSFSLWPVVKPAISHQALAFFFFFIISVAYTCLLFSLQQAIFFLSSATTSKCHASSGNSVSPCMMMDCPNARVSPYSPEMKLVCYYKVIISW